MCSHACTSQEKEEQNLFEIGPLLPLFSCASHPSYLLDSLTALCFLWFITPATITKQEEEWNRMNKLKAGVCGVLGWLP